MRIIGGSAKGTALLSPVGKGMTRPTLGRVRESIFNVLANVGMKDTRVLDIFAGTGAMGLEALSRGAAHATFLDKATCKLIRENAVKCHVENKADVLPGDVSRSLAKLAGNRYDYLFMDPPYGKGYIDQILALIFACRLPYYCRAFYRRTAGYDLFGGEMFGMERKKGRKYCCYLSPLPGF